jgi:amidase
VAVAANLCAAAVGTETSGSILSPAASNSAVGIKPTLGLISRSGIIPITAVQDTAGPIARTVTDAAILLGAMTGVDPRDAATRASRKRAFADYTRFLTGDGLKGSRIGVPRAVFWERAGDHDREICNESLARLVDAGATVIDPVAIANAEAVSHLHMTAMLYTFKRDLNRYLRRLGPAAAVHSLADVISFDDEHPAEMLRYGHTLLLAGQAARGTNTTAYRQARADDLRLAKTEGIDATLAQHQLDALVFPGAYGAAIGAKAGYPSITVPAGYTEEGRPVGLTFLGAAWSEPKLISLAYAFEQASRARQAPKL